MCSRESWHERAPLRVRPFASEHHNAEGGRVFVAFLQSSLNLDLTTRGLAGWLNLEKGERAS